MKFRIISQYKYLLYATNKHWICTAVTKTTILPPTTKTIESHKHTQLTIAYLNPTPIYNLLKPPRSGITTLRIYIYKKPDI